MNTQFEREEDQLVEDLNSGRITRDEFNRAMRELIRDTRAAAEEAAQQAYDNEMERWS
jgi:predicted RNA-binding protein associated with RNAse of E/G family